MKKIEIMTTASLPWFTGTSINPLFRAVYLALSGSKVKIHLPWIPPTSQKVLFGNKKVFISKESQENYIRSYLENIFESYVEFKNNLEISWYSAIYISCFQSIFPKNNIFKLFSSDSVIILEEPEHLLVFSPYIFLNKKTKKQKNMFWALSIRII